MLRSIEQISPEVEQYRDGWNGDEPDERDPSRARPCVADGRKQDEQHPVEAEDLEEAPDRNPGESEGESQVRGIVVLPPEGASRDHEEDRDEDHADVDDHKTERVAVYLRRRIRERQAAREREDQDEGPDDQVRNHLEFRIAFVKVEPPLLHLPSIRGPFRSTESTSPHGRRYEAATYLRTGTGSGRPRRDASRDNH